MLGILLFFILPYIARLQKHPRAFAISSALLLAGWFIVPKSSERIFTTHIYMGLVFILLTVALAIHPFGLLVNRVTVGLGQISYSLYLTHTLIIHLALQVSGYFMLSRYLAPAAWHIIMGCTVLVLSIAVSVVIYRYIETPGINIGRRFIGWLQQCYQVSNLVPDVKEPTL